MFQKYLDCNYNQADTTNSASNNNNTANSSSSTSTSVEKKHDIYRDIIPKLKNICLDSILASYSRIGKWRPQTPTF